MAAPSKAASRCRTGRRTAARGFDAELKAERLDLDAATAFVAFAGGTAGRMAGRRRSSRSISAAPSRPARSCGRCWPSSATAPKTLSLDQLKIGQPDSVTLEGAGSFDRVNATGKLALNSSAASLGQITALIAPFAPSLAARLNAMGTSSGPGARETRARSRQERRTGRSRQCARRRRSRRAAAQGRRHDHREAGRCGGPRHRSRGARAQRDRRSRRSCRRSRAAPCWRCSVSIARSRPAKARRNSRARRRAHGVRRCGSRRRSRERGSMPTRKVLPNRGHRKPRPVSNLKVRSADLAPLLDLKPSRHAGAEYRPVLARLARRQQSDLRRSRQQHRRFAAARPPGGHAWRGEETSRAKSALDQLALAPAFALAHWRGRTRCRRAARRRAGEGLARQGRVSGVARRCCRAAANCSR